HADVRFELLFLLRADLALDERRELQLARDRHAATRRRQVAAALLRGRVGLGFAYALGAVLRERLQHRVAHARCPRPVEAAHEHALRECGRREQPKTGDEHPCAAHQMPPSATLPPTARTQSLRHVRSFALIVPPSGILSPHGGGSLSLSSSKFALPLVEMNTL